MNKSNNTVIYNELIQTLQGEASAETEIVLPDYCPNIMKLVRTEATAFTHSQTVRADKAFMEGVVEFRILYLSENDDALQTVLQQVPFSYSCELQGPADGMQIKTKCRVSYANTRALSPQKLYVKATVEACMYVFAQSSEELLDDGKKNGVVLKTEKTEISDISEAGRKILKISRELEPGDNVHPSKIVRYEYFFGQCDKKVLNNKVIAKSDITLRIFYIDPDKNGLASFESKIPLSQVLELNGDCEEKDCLISMSLSECHLAMKEVNGKESLIDCDLEIIVSADCVGRTEIEIPTDAFSKEKEITCAKKTVSVQNVMPVDERIEFRGSFPLDSAVSIMDISVSTDAVNVIAEGDSRTVTCRGAFICNVLYKDAAEEAASVEKALPFSLELPVRDVDSVKGDVRAELSTVSYSFAPDSAEVRISGQYTGYVITRTEYQTISDITILDTPKPDGPSAVVYYASSGDSVWDIAKRYSASPDEISRYNNIQGDVITEDKMIFISR